MYRFEDPPALLFVERGELGTKDVTPSLRRKAKVAVKESFIFNDLLYLLL